MLNISLEKNTSANNPEREKRPRTELDVKFLAIVQELMTQRGLKSDRAMSLELGRGPDFINRVRNGLQSATPEAWELLRTKYQVDPSTVVNQSQVTGIAVGINHGVAAHTYTMADCQKDRDEALAKCEVLQKENELLRQQLAMQTELIAAKDETLALLRGGHNRPN